MEVHFYKQDPKQLNENTFKNVNLIYYLTRPKLNTNETINKYIYIVKVKL